ncbi:MAG TPA: DUF167 domain-containing protein [Anaerolineales bacterium]|jgi:hypothetical protein|nr:DUF167 domain-containing protein [Anaerolineales bacterium]
MTRKFDLHGGKRGSALAVRITPRSSRDQIVGVLDDGTVKVHLASEPSDEETNRQLIIFLAEVLGVPKSRIEIVAGPIGWDRLVAVMDMDVDTVNQRIIAHMD